jgi:hypothetical protein
MDVSIQAVSPELICELRMTEGSVVEAGGDVAATAGVGDVAGVAASATDVVSDAAALAPGVDVVVV